MEEQLVKLGGSETCPKCKTLQVTGLNLPEECLECLKQDSESGANVPLDRLVINRFVYHYCSKYKDIGGAINTIDGIAQLEKRITCMDDYRKLKILIEPEHYDKLSISSLAFIGMEQGL